MTVNYSNLATTKWNQYDGLKASYPALKIDNSQLISIEDTKQTKEVKDEVTISKDCTDGKDDGKIGLLSAAGNVLQGAANTVVDTAKSCFFDENDEFSIGRTLLAAGATAACIAFPPLGLAACALGTAVGAVKIGSSVINAVNAKTDAEAKQAWQNVGSGAITAGASVAGGKASLSAMKFASTAGTNGLSAIESVSEKASLAEKAAALGKDAISSTKNNGKLVKENLSSVKEALQAGKEVADLKLAQLKASKINGTALTDKETAILKEAEIREVFLSDKAKALNKKLGNTKVSGEKLVNESKTSAKNILPNLKENIKHPVETVKSGLDKIKSVSLKDIKTNLSENAKAAFNTIKEKGYSDALSKYGYPAVYEALSATAGVQITSNAI